MYDEVFNFHNYLIFCRTFIDIFTRSLSESNNRIKLIESALSSLELLFRDHETIKNEHNYLLRNKKELKEEISAIKREIENKKRSINEYITSGEKDEEFNLHEKCAENEQKLKNLTKKCEHYKSSAMKAFENISRTEVAEIKYLFNSNYEFYQRMFELVTIILTEEETIISAASSPVSNNVVLDKEAIRKCITDINIMNRIKEQGMLENKHEKIIKILY